MHFLRCCLAPQNGASLVYQSMSRFTSIKLTSLRVLPGDTVYVELQARHLPRTVPESCHWGSQTRVVWPSRVVGLHGTISALPILSQLIHIHHYALCQLPAPRSTCRRRRARACLHLGRLCYCTYHPSRFGNGTLLLRARCQRTRPPLVMQPSSTVAGAATKELHTAIPSLGELLTPTLIKASSKFIATRSVEA